MISTILEAAALDALEPRWLEQGYRVIRRPDPGELPKFLGTYEPDAIAVGRSPSLVIEVVNPQSRTHDVRIAQLQRLFENRDDWRLEVVYAPEATEGVRPVAVDDIDATLARAARLSESDPQVALLLAWAALEAGARLLHPDETRRGLPSGSLLDLLGSLGDTTRDEQATLHRIAKLRNALSHGQLDAAVSGEDVSQVLGIASRLRRVVRGTQ
jgi:hypothetical protein